MGGQGQGGTNRTAIAKNIQAENKRLNLIFTNVYETTGPKYVGIRGELYIHIHDFLNANLLHFLPRSPYTYCVIITCRS